MEINTKRINIFGGPGCGKSILSCHLFVQLKIYGINSELIREEAKNFAIQNKKITIKDQINFIENQIKLEKLLINHTSFFKEAQGFILGRN